MSVGIDWPRALRACAVAALISALVSALGLMSPLLAALGAGFLGVNLYHRRGLTFGLTARSGAQLGALCGLFFFGMAAVFQTFSIALFHGGGQLRQEMLEALQQAASRSSDPQVLAAFEQLKTPQGLAAMLILVMIALLVLSIIAGVVAGAITGAVLARRDRP
jgi:hypothetical protein